MKKITNTEEANHYYKLVNDSIDEYINTWKIKPTNLTKYLKSSKFENFLNKRGLGDVEGIKRILKDVLEDRTHMEKDGVMKFESFRESLDNPFIYEKILADYYNTGLGHIESIGDNLFKVTDFGKELEVFIFSEYDINNIKKTKENVDFEFLCEKYLTDDELLFDMQLKDIIDEEKFRELFNDRVTFDTMIKEISLDNNCVYKEKFKDHYIYEKGV